MTSRNDDERGRGIPAILRGGRSWLCRCRLPVQGYQRKTRVRNSQVKARSAAYGG